MKGALLQGARIQTMSFKLRQYLLPLTCNDLVGDGEHTRLRVFRSAPSPVGSSASTGTRLCETFGCSDVAGEAPAAAPGAGALPQSTASRC